MNAEAGRMKPEAGRMNAQPGFIASLRGRPAECDGGGLVAGTHFAGREEFTGVLTGEFVDHGEPPWRWYRLTDLSRKPENYPADSVWCECESLFLIGGDSDRAPGPTSTHRNEA